MAALSAAAFAVIVWGAVGLVLAAFGYVLWAVLAERGADDG